MNLSDPTLFFAGMFALLGIGTGLGISWERNRPGGTRDQRARRLRLAGRLDAARTELEQRRAALIAYHPSARPGPARLSLVVGTPRQSTGGRP